MQVFFAIFLNFFKYSYFSISFSKRRFWRNRYNIMNRIPEVSKIMPTGA